MSSTSLPCTWQVLTNPVQEMSLSLYSLPPCSCTPAQLRRSTACRPGSRPDYPDTDAYACHANAHSRYACSRHLGLCLPCRRPVPLPPLLYLLSVKKVKAFTCRPVPLHRPSYRPGTYANAHSRCSRPYACSRPRLPLAALYPCTGPAPAPTPMPTPAMPTPTPAAPVPTPAPAQGEGRP